MQKIDNVFSDSRHDPDEAPDTHQSLPCPLVIPMQPKRHTNAETFFIDWFIRLRGFAPYPWQTALFLAVLTGTPPSLLYIPTGGGKTDIITAWLLAILWQIKQTGTTAVPRRLYFAVDRRVVVDQTEPLALTLLEKVRNEPEFRLFAIANPFGRTLGHFRPARTASD